jgi:hypothetical protein
MMNVCGGTSPGEGTAGDWYKVQGSWILLSWSCTARPTDTSIWKVHPDGSDPQLLLGDDPYFINTYYGPRMSPDGGTIAYSEDVSGSDGGTAEVGRFGDLGNGYFVHQNDAFETCWTDNHGWACGASHVTWSPSGAEVAYGVSGPPDWEVDWIAILDATDCCTPVLLVQGSAPVWG